MFRVTRVVGSLLVIFSIFFFATIACAQVNAATGDFTIVLFPDTQNEAQFYPNVLDIQTQWVVNNRSAWNIQAVLGLGDIVNDGASTTQQSNADAAIRLLDNARLPYFLAIGNHDYDGANTGVSKRLASGFNQWFGPQRYAGYTWYKGNLNGSNENFYGELTINGKTYLFLLLEFVPRTVSLQWAAQVLQAHPGDEVILVTHSFMFSDNTRVDRCDTNDLNRDNDGDETWANFASKYLNIIMVVNGHITSQLAARRADLGINGNLVNQMLSNYQVLANGGDGWIRLLSFHPSSNTIDVKTYSPYLNAYKTDSKNQFTIFWHNPNIVTGQSRITGRVTSTSCTVIPGAQVTAGGVSTTTDSAGRYSLTVNPGSYSLAVSASGFTSGAQTVKAWDGYGPDINFYLAASSPTVSPTSLIFGSQAVGATSPSHTVTVFNGTSAAVPISGASVSGDFLLTSFTCPTSLPASASCSLAVAFRPTTTGTRSGVLTIGINGGQQTVALTGGSSLSAACTATGSSPSVTICTPAANATVSSPLHVSAAAVDSTPIKVLQIYLNGVKVYEVAASSLDTSINLALHGSNRLTVQALDTAGLTFKQTIFVTWP